MKMTHRLMIGAMILVATSTLIALATLHISEIRTTSILFDDAFIANVAKNLAAGNGYSSAYYRIHPFDPEITTGPLLVVPAAVLILVFGNRYWVPHLAYALCLWTLLATVLVFLWRRMKTNEFAATTSLIAVGLIVFSTQEFGLLGEIPAALVIVLAALICVDSRRPTMNSAIAGMAVAFAIITKTIAALAIPAFVYIIVCDKSVKPRRHRIAWFATGLAIPLLALEAWKFTAQGNTAAWMRLKHEEFELMFGGESLSGATTLIRAFENPGLVVNTVLHNVEALTSSWGGPLALAAAGIATLVAGQSSRHSTTADAASSLRTVSFGLFAAAATHAAWWVMLSPTAWTRHLLPAVMYWLIGLAILIPLQSRRSVFKSITSGLLLLPALSPQLRNVPAPGMRPRADGRVAALIATSDRVREIQGDPEVVLLGCDWWHNPDVDYLLPGEANFRDCLKVAPGDVRGKTLVLVRSEFFNWERSERLQRFQESCEQHVLFRKVPFVVSECPRLP